MRWISMMILTFSFACFAVSDTFLLAEILVNTTRELEELERLITKTQEHTEKLSNFADTIDDYSYRAQRLKAWAEDIRDLNGEDPSTLAEVNDLIRRIRVLEEDTVRIYKEYTVRIYRNKKENRKFDKIAANQYKNAKRYKSQALRRQKNSADSIQQVAQNTAAMAYEQAKTNQMIALQNKKMGELYEVILSKEKRDLAKESKLKEMYSDK